MIWRSLNFWRVAAIVLFIAVLALSFPLIKRGPHFVLEDSSMQVVEAPSHGALFKYTIKNDGSSGGEAYVNFHAYLYERGSDSEDDYKTVGVNPGETKSGEFFMELRPGQTVHDWRIELT
jgi:hypothetical protein